MLTERGVLVNSLWDLSWTPIDLNFHADCVGFGGTLWDCRRNEPLPRLCAQASDEPTAVDRFESTIDQKHVRSAGDRLDDKYFEVLCLPELNVPA